MLRYGRSAAAAWFWLVTLLAATAPSGSVAQAVVKGRVVTDPAGTRIPDAEVLARPGDCKTHSYSKGEFVLASLPSGLVEVIVRAIGFRQVSVLLDLQANDTLEFTFELRRQVPVLPPIEVLPVPFRWMLEATLLSFRRRNLTRR